MRAALGGWGAPSATAGVDGWSARHAGRVGTDRDPTRLASGNLGVARYATLLTGDPIVATGHTVLSGGDPIMLTGHNGPERR